MAIALSALPFATWRVVLSSDLHGASENASNMATIAICFLIGTFVILRKRRPLIFCIAMVSGALMLPDIVMTVRGADRLMHRYPPATVIWSPMEMLAYFYVYWIVVALLCAILLAVTPGKKWLRFTDTRSEKFGYKNIFIFASLFSFYLSITFHIVNNSTVASRQFSPMGVTLYGFGAWMLLLSILFIYLPRRMGLPSLSMLLICLFIWFSRTNDNHAIRITAQTEGGYAGANNLPDYFVGWLQSRHPRSGERFPIIIVAAEGGGIRAAYWTATILASLDAQTEGRFSNHLFAISSVSGGSFGAALYASALADRRDGILPRSTDVTSLVQEVAAEDYLSPLIAGTLFNDFAQRLLPFVMIKDDRAAFFERAWEDTWNSKTNSRRFEQTLDSLYLTNHRTDYSYKVPALFFNATEVNTGRKFLISNIRVDHADFPETYFLNEKDHPLYDLSKAPLSALAHMSARFPYLSPAGTITGKPSPNIYHEAERFGLEKNLPAIDPNSKYQWGAVVDGGYLDNSGAGTAAELLRALRFYEPQVMRTLALLPGITDLQLDYYIVLVSNDPDSSSVRPNVYQYRESTWWQTYVLSTDDKFAQERAISGLPARPVEPSDAVLYRLFGNAFKLDRAPDTVRLFRLATPVSELTSPISAVLNARTARADAAKTLLAALANEPPAGFLQSRCCDPDSVAQSELLGDFNPCRLSPRAFEFSLGEALPKSRGADPLVENVPPLGWYLRRTSRDAMNEAANELSFQGFDVLTQDVVNAYAKKIGYPRSSCEVSTVGNTTDKGILNFIAKNHSSYNSPVDTRTLETPPRQ
ncbi:hypothetical protein [Paraburkholderia sp. BL17N1]|uniref:hypothetical protein n=1 Tax=Paraburkholderia sp. BL17N1 TaxID=1938798 RepID=UPI0011C46F40|nr:hypothetical protein [Paraburkholderia sp. BL17N1]